MRPTFVRPLIPADATGPPPGEGWLHEHKWDGYRFQVVKNGLEVRLFSNGGAEYTERLPWRRSPRCRSALPSSTASSASSTPRASSNFCELHEQMRTRWPGENDLVFMAFDFLRRG